MEVLSRDELKTLVEKRKGPCVSIFMPTHREGGAEIQQNPIRFKNMLREAEERLVAGGPDHLDVEELLAPVQALLKDTDFWRHLLDGIALFRSPEFFRYYRLPLDLKELVVVTDRFHIKSLLPLLSGDGQFYVLALSQNEVRVLRGTRYHIEEIDLEGIPKSRAEALKYDDYEKQSHFYPGSQGRASGKIMPLSGHGVGGTDDKREPHDDILRYFHQIDAGLHKLLRDERAPLVLAGVEYLFPIYREANTYRHLMDEGIPGNPEGVRAEELHEQAWALVQPYFQKAQREAADQYRQLVSSGRTSNDIKEIVPAAHYGRVESLFVALGVERWGTFDPATNEIHLHASAEPGDEDLLDLAAAQTFLHRGNVYVVDPGQIPDDQNRSPLAAIFRY